MKKIRNISFLILIFLLNIIIGIGLTRGKSTNFYNLGLKALKDGNNDKAINYLLKQYDEKSDDLILISYLTYAYFVERKYKQALEMADRCIELKDNCILGLLIKAEISYQWRNYSDAKILFENILKLDDNIRLVYYRLYELKKENNPKLAHKYYLMAFKKSYTDISQFLPSKNEYQINISGYKGEYITSIKLDDNYEKQITNTTSISQAGTLEVDSKKIIMTIKKGDKINLKMGTVFQSYKEGDFIILITRLISAVLILIILKIFRFRKERKAKETVLNNYRFYT